MFSKNRRAGSRTHIPMYFTLKNGEVQFDEIAYRNVVDSNVLGSSLADRQKAVENSFGDVFSIAKRLNSPDEIDLSSENEEFRIIPESDGDDE
jgi:hypothetical protein